MVNYRKFIDLQLLTFIILSIIIQSCTNAENKVKSIRNGNITGLRIEWISFPQQQDPNRYDRPNFLVILSSKELEVINNFKQSLSNIDFYSGSKLDVLLSSSIGKLIINNIDDEEIQIDVTFSGFFIGGKRSMDYLFFSPTLSKFIFEIINQSEKKDMLSVPNGLWDNLSKRNFKK